MVLTSVSAAATPALTGLIINLATATAKDNGSARVLIAPGALLVALSVFGWIAQRQQILMLGTAGQRAVYDLRTAVFSAISRLDVAYFESVESGDLMSRLINDVNQVDSFLSQGFRRLLGAVVGLTATLIAMLWVNWRLALTTLIVVPVMLGVTRLFGLIARGAFRTRQEAIGDVSATLAEEIGGIKVAQAFNRTDRNRTQFSERNAANRDANVSAAVVSSAFSPVLGVDLGARHGDGRRGRWLSCRRADRLPGRGGGVLRLRHGSSSTRSRRCRRCTPTPSPPLPAESACSRCSTRRFT